ncbi:hypothetical protein PHMEG_0002951 [Phytophthora megakarya]|uniref:Uncharacterized protein n=1 Tax=Phytophthora megakarya TaxID=4795 RepID=A0A225WXE7_9STRA|nr:hypothetical protein PHMEG_0002951 [Phytophthora megakarya]
MLSRRHITFITGGFNAKLGRRCLDESFVGPHACGYRNRNGHELASYVDLLTGYLLHLRPD